MSSDKQMLSTDIFLLLRQFNGKESLLEKILLNICSKDRRGENREDNLI
jgi:hypothetical protein